MISQGEWCDLARLWTKDTVPGHYLQYGIDGSSPCSWPAGYASNNPLASHTTSKTNHYHPQKIIHHRPNTPLATYATGHYATGHSTTGPYTTGQIHHWPNTPLANTPLANTPPATPLPAIYTTGQIHRWPLHYRPLTPPAIYITGHMHYQPLTLLATYTTSNKYHGGICYWQYIHLGIYTASNIHQPEFIANQCSTISQIKKGPDRDTGLSQYRQIHRKGDRIIPIIGNVSI